MGEWVSLRLGDVCTKIGSGATPLGGGSVYLDQGEFALIRSQNVYNDGFHREGLAFITKEHAEELDQVEVMPGDVLLNITGDSVARCCQVDDAVLPARVNQHVAIVRPNPRNLDARFLRYFLVSPQMQEQMLSWAGSGGTRNALTKGMIEAFRIGAPLDVAEQQEIAQILGTLDDKIELNRRMNETLEAMARAIFKSWFVDFLPVRAKMAARQNDPSLLLPGAEPGTWFVYAIECNDGSLYIGHTEDLRQRWQQHVGGRGADWTAQHPPARVPYWERQPSRNAAVEREKWMKTGFGRKWLKKEIAARTQTGDPLPLPAPGAAWQAGWQRGQSLPGLPADTFDLWPSSFQNSPLGPIPQGWPVGRLSGICSTQYGFTASATEEAVGPRFLRVTDINKKNWIDWDSVPYCEIEGADLPKYRLGIGDILVARMADPGKSAIIEEDVHAVFASYLVRLKADSLATAYYVYGFLKSQTYEEYTQGATSGSVQANMNAKVIVGAELCIPPKELVDAHAAQALPLRQRIVSNLRETSTLAAIRDALLPKLISGEIRVKDAEQKVERAM